MLFIPGEEARVGTRLMLSRMVANYLIFFLLMCNSYYCDVVYRVVLTSGVGFIHVLYKWMSGHNKTPHLHPL